MLFISLDTYKVFMYLQTFFPSVSWNSYSLRYTCTSIPHDVRPQGNIRVSQYVFRSRPECGAGIRVCVRQWTTLSTVDALYQWGTQRPYIFFYSSLSDRYLFVQVCHPLPCLYFDCVALKSNCPTWRYFKINIFLPERRRMLPM